MRAYFSISICTILMAMLLLPATEVRADDVELLEELNALPTIAVSDRTKSYRLFFDGAADLTPLPGRFEGGIQPGMISPRRSGWSELSNWAEANAHMAAAIKEASERPVFGLPYGANNVSAAYRNNNFYAAVGGETDFDRIHFPYLETLRRAHIYAVTEVYRRMEANQVEEALDLIVANLFFLRQICDREFIEEKEFGISELLDMLETTRDVFFTYRDRISADQYRQLAVTEIPFLRPDRNALFMPEADRIVARAIFDQVFDDRGQPIVEEFKRIFASIQSRNQPLVRFGAVRQWDRVANVHDSLDASLQRLRLVYDDWWRRWRVQAYDPVIESVPTEFERTNPVRSAAVLFALKDIQNLFMLRRQLIAEVNATGMAAGICGYYKTYNTWPRDQRRLYAAHCRKSSDVDPYDRNMGTFLFIYPSSSHTLDTPYGRLRIPAQMSILYSRGEEGGDRRASQHTSDGVEGDIVFWPPVRAMAREQGLLN